MHSVLVDMMDTLDYRSPVVAMVVELDVLMG